LERHLHFHIHILKYSNLMIILSVIKELRI